MQISVAMMAKGYITQMTYITQEVLAQGRVDAGAKISGQMMKEGNMDFVKIWNEARKQQDGEEATDPDPKSVKDQLKEAVGSVSNNAKGIVTANAHLASVKLLFVASPCPTTSLPAAMLLRATDCNTCHLLC